MQRYNRCYHTLQHTAIHCNTLQHTAIHCNTLQHTATQYNTLQHNTTHYNTLLHTASHCNTMQHTAVHCYILQHTATHCTASHCSTLQRIATHDNTLLLRHRLQNNTLMTDKFKTIHKFELMLMTQKQCVVLWFVYDLQLVSTYKFLYYFEQIRTHPVESAYSHIYIFS